MEWKPIAFQREESRTQEVTGILARENAMQKTRLMPGGGSARL